MYSRVTLLEIDTIRTTVAEAADVFKEAVLPQLREQEGFEGAVVLATPEGKGMIITVWDTEETAANTAATHMALFKAPPGREYYEVVFADVPAVFVG
jgi:heme-degrading monooxygenase HmoA